MREDRSLLFGALAGERRSLLLALAAGAGVSLATVGLAASSAELIVRAAERPKVLTLTVLLGLVQLFALAKAAGRYVERMATHRVVLRAMARLRSRVARLVEPLVPVGLGPRTADAVALVCDDVDRTQELLVAVAAPLTAAVVAGVAAVCAAGLVVPSAAWVELAVVVVLAAALPSWAARLGARTAREVDAAQRGARDAVHDVVRDGAELVGIGAGAWIFERVATVEVALDRARRRGARRRGLVQALSLVVAGGGVVAIGWLTVDAATHHQIARSLVAMPALGAMAAGELLAAIAPVAVGVRSSLDALGRLDALREVAPVVHEPVRVTHDVADATTLHAHHVAVAYRDHEVLHDGTLDVRPGAFVVLNGPSGSGKTTFARTLARFIDTTRGDLRLGDATMAELRGDQVRARVGIVDDEPHVFRTSLAGNLRIAAPTASDDEVRRALEDAGLAPLLSTLPEGLATELDGDHVLSGGERRRLGVARELLTHRPIALFDEPTEGLDAPSADALLTRLAERFADRSVIVVSHRRDDHAHATAVVTLVDGACVAPAP